MKHPLSLALAVAMAGATALPAIAQSDATKADSPVSAQPAPQAQDNPFFADSTLPLLL